MDDTISRQAAIEALTYDYHGMISDESMKIYQIINWLSELPSAQPELRWIPFKTKPLTKAEKEEYPEKEPVSLENIVHPQILDDAEKRYLKGVIRPFRDRVKYIAKICVDHLYDEPDYHICIIFNDGNDAMNFPSFDESHMYKCMEEDRAYTLEELGL